jgi:hypothetical protein
MPHLQVKRAFGPLVLRSACGVVDRGGTAAARNSQNAKLPELTFHAVLGDGAREVRFERLLTR